MFQDDNTKDPHEILVEKYGAEAAKASKPGHIYMDAMGFGMGQSCLQVSKTKFFLETNCLLKIDFKLILPFQNSNSNAMELLKTQCCLDLDEREKRIWGLSSTQWYFNTKHSKRADITVALMTTDF